MHDIKKNNIIFTTEQAGGIDALDPVMKKIESSKKIAYSLFLDKESIYKYAKKKGIKNLHLTDASLDELTKIFKKINPDIIFTDTNNTAFENSIDKKSVKIAKALGKPAISFVDAWINYKGSFGENLEYIPDYILAIDEEMKEDLKNIGIPQNLIKVTGSPRFDKFLKIKKKKVKKDTIVFYSQSFPSGEFSELDVFKDLLAAIEKNCPEKKIVIKFHPSREPNQDKYDSIIKTSKLIIKKAGKNVNSDDLMARAGLILGMSSMALFDAALLGKKVLSYQPGISIKNDTLRSNVYGWSMPVYQKNDISGKIKDVLRKKVSSGKKFRANYTKNNSTAKVMTLINSILKQK